MFRRFLNDNSGNFAMIAALVAFPLLSTVILGFDHMRFKQLESELKVAVDAAMVATANDFVAGRIKGKSVDAYMKDFVLANLNHAKPEQTNVSVNVRYRKDGQIAGFIIDASVVYVPVSGPLADFIPSTSAKGERWTARF